MTIGYEGLDISTFLAALRANKVATLVDVRELPLSRKKGFSKVALAAAVNKAGIRYLHVPKLGCPRDIRHAYHSAGRTRSAGEGKPRVPRVLRSGLSDVPPLLDHGRAGD